MKILLVTEFFPINKDIQFSGGVEARSYFLAKNLAMKHQVTVLTSYLEGSKKEEQMEGFNIIRVGGKRDYKATTGDILTRVKFVLSAIKVGKTLDVEIIDGSNFLTHFIAKKIAMSKRIPVVAWYPDVWIGQWIKNAGLAGVLGEVLERFNLLCGFDHYIAISKQTKIKLLRFVKKNIDVIYCGVDQEEFNKDIPKFKIPTIISIARLASYKNHQVLIRAIAEVNRRLTCNLLIIGSGPEYKRLKQLAKELGVDEYIEIKSNLTREELVKNISQSTIFSLPSLVEGFGIATIEASAAGLPYVNSNIEVQKEVTRNGQGGFLVDPDDIKGFADAFYTLLTEEQIYLKKSMEAQDLARLYDWSRIAEETEKVYKELL